jgi:ADP-ribose pyrophosphatase YjhB (NUDIX family)
MVLFISNMTESLHMLTGPLEAEDDLNLTVIRTRDTVLMGQKTRGFGRGKRVLPGGKARYYLGEAGISLLPPDEEAAREAREETGLSLRGVQLAQRGALYITDERDSRVIKLYEGRVDAGATTSSTELADLSWEAIEALPYGEMPGDYKLWLPHVLAGYAITAFFEVDEDQEVVSAKLFRQKVEPLERMEEVAVGF